MNPLLSTFTESGFPSVSKTTIEHVASNPNPLTSSGDIPIISSYMQINIVFIIFTEICQEDFD